MIERARLRWAVPLAAIALSSSAARAAESAVVLMYHHVAKDTPASTSVTVNRFAAHMAHLADNGFHVWPLLRILEHLRDQEALPDKTVAITFDDGYVSVLTHALPELEQRGWPFTVFVSTDYVDKGYGNYLSWPQLRELSEHGATIGNHSKTHPHLVRRAPNEGEREWAQRVREEISGAADRIDEEVGDAAIPVFAYPYGEYDGALEKIVGSLGLWAFGQQSGAVGETSDLLAAPRFPMSTGYDGLDQFSLRVLTRPLPVVAETPARHILEVGESRPMLELELGPGDYRLDGLKCYASNQGQIDVDWIDKRARRFIVRPVEALRPGRTKYNCTAPAASQTGVYYWYSHLWMAKNPDGTWYND
jgi:biofilm PGA synthesis lipoprotein PgaB